jgi:hypothetical protein
LSGQVHVFPERDLREHDTSSGVLCPCLPRLDPEDPNVVLHNSYDAREVGDVMRDALLSLGEALVDLRYPFSKEQYELVRRAFDLLERHWPVHHEQERARDRGDGVEQGG